jgi:hypothetical protein
MAEGVVASSIVKAVLAKFASSIWSELALLRRFRIDLKAMEDEFGTIRGVLADAEARGGGGDTAVCDWLRRLKDLAHEIDDFLDACHSDLRTARRRRRPRQPSLRLHRRLLHPALRRHGAQTEVFEAQASRRRRRERQTPVESQCFSTGASGCSPKARDHLYG